MFRAQMGTSTPPAGKRPKNHLGPLAPQTIPTGPPGLLRAPHRFGGRTAIIVCWGWGRSPPSRTAERGPQGEEAAFQRDSEKDGY